MRNSIMDCEVKTHEVGEESGGITCKPSEESMWVTRSDSDKVRWDEAGGLTYEFGNVQEALLTFSRAVLLELGTWKAN